MCQKKVMRKRSSEQLSEEPPKKRISPGGNVLPIQIPPGEVITDLTGKQWKLGKTMGHGGFGEIYLASDNIKEPVKPSASYVVKVENHSNGPLFVEINCLLRIARENMINTWKKEHNLKSLGMPHYIASGSHTINNEKLRFLVLPRYDQDLEKLFVSKDKKCNLKTAILICIQVLEVLEYIHSKGYVHCDIKASNILHSLQSSIKDSSLNRLHRECNPIRSCRYRKMMYYPQYNGRNLRYRQRLNYNENMTYETRHIDIIDDFEKNNQRSKQTDQIIVIDYGLATKYRQSDGNHKQYSIDERKAHAGTILFCSIDSHLGASSRRSDLETLGYNLIYWLTSELPWSDNVSNPETVQHKKEISLNNIELFLKSCFSMQEYPSFIFEYFTYVKSLTFESKPDYKYCKKLFQTALEEYGYKNDGYFDFNNLEGWGQKPQISKKQKNMRSKLINFDLKQKTKSDRIPLTSNILLDKPVLRKKTNLKHKKKLNWSEILAADPEEILRQNNKQNKSIQEVTKSRERKLTDSSDSSFGSSSLHHLDILSLNPTYAMLNVYNKCRDKNANFNSFLKHGKDEIVELDHRKGNTLAMDLVLTRMNQRRLAELESEIENNYMNVPPIRITRRLKCNEKKKVPKIITGSTIAIKEVNKRKQHRPLRNRGYGLRG